jgi:hypothetical protein
VGLLNIGGKEEGGEGEGEGEGGGFSSYYMSRADQSTSLNFIFASTLIIRLILTTDLIFGSGPKINYLILITASHDDNNGELKRIIETEGKSHLFGVTNRSGFKYELKKFSFALEFNYDINFNQIVDIDYETPMCYPYALNVIRQLKIQYGIMAISFEYKL